MVYCHQDTQGKAINLPVGKVLCVGRNYAAHAKELGNEVPQEPLLFLKPGTSLCSFQNEIVIPQQFGEVHFETELAVLIAESITKVEAKKVEEAIWGYGLALDLTLRDIQNDLKAKGQPWEKAKAFDGACPVTAFVEKNNFQGSAVFAQCEINQQIRQKLDSREMLWPVYELIAYMSQFFTLQAGDIVLTGTPEGVGALKSKDQICLSLFDAQQNLKLRCDSCVK